MKILIPLLLILLLSACNKPTPWKMEPHVESAHFKTGRGVSLPESMCKSLGVQVADVTEQKIVPKIRIPLQVTQGSAHFEASGWITAAQAKDIRVGQRIQLLLPDEKSVIGTVLRLEKTAYTVLGDFEVTVRTDAPLSVGMAVTALVELSPSNDIVAIPPGAIMKTAEGEFVYVINDDYFMRTPVQTGLRNDEAVEITDGLYAGDQIVTAQVTPIWMTELQTLRAGQSCCKGH